MVPCKLLEELKPNRAGIPEDISVKLFFAPVAFNILSKKKKNQIGKKSSACSLSLPRRYRSSKPDNGPVSQWSKHLLGGTFCR